MNVQVRSLEVQLDGWNGNASVGEVATLLWQAANDELGKTTYPPRPNRQASVAFASFLEGWSPPLAVNVAAPGLSPHGQARAFDFQVERDGTLVADTDASRIEATWEGQGWARRLAAAVSAASDKFHGPLLCHASRGTTSIDREPAAGRQLRRNPFI